MELTTLATLPAEVVIGLIDVAQDFSVIINLYEHNRPARQLLGCKSLTGGKANSDYLVDETTSCRLDPNQNQILADLNVRFSLGVTKPLSYAKLKRAYLHSGANPTCAAYASLWNCLKSATTVDNFRILHDEWIGQYEALMSPQIPLFMFEWYNKLLVKLGIRYYRQRSLDPGEHVWNLVKIKNNNKLRYFRCKAWLRHILAPYKVRTSREIRAEYGEQLYNRQVDDKVKVAIWKTKYNLDWDKLDLTDIRSMVPANIDPEGFIYIALASRLGKDAHINTLRELQVPFISKLDPALLHQNDRLTGITSVNLVKRGFFGIDHVLWDLLENNVIGWDNQEVSLINYLRNFDLENMIRVYDSVGETIDLEATVIYSQSSRLYFEYKEKYKIQPQLTDYSSGFLFSIRAVDMVNDLLANTVDPNLIQRWTHHNWKFLAKIWVLYGRQQFEDSLIYLQSRLRSSIVYSNTGLFHGALNAGAVGLLTYLFGYRIDTQRQLHPVDSLIEIHTRSIPQFEWARIIEVRDHEHHADMLQLLNNLREIWIA